MTKYLSDLARVQRQISEIESAIDEAYTNGEVEEYRFNSGEGQQMAKRRSLKELETVLERLEAKEMRLLNRINGRGLINMGMRRKRYTYGRGNYGRN